MQKYIRCHIVEAKSCTLDEWEQETGRTWNEPDRPRTEEGYKCDYPSGYSGWCPKVEFEKVSRPIDGMTFGMAIEAMKLGKKVARAGWNGKGMYVWIMPGSTVKDCKTITDPHLKAIDEAEGEIRFLGSVRMRTATGDVLTGWLASQTDMLSDDWQIVE
ncbi:MAG: DUF2829 domain-containing protein [Kiritimatiellae bacterium]|nr:DUF2829 domain-containing protein [Kiritimatiellia bacterium]